MTKKHFIICAIIIFLTTTGVTAVTLEFLYQHGRLLPSYATWNSTSSTYTVGDPSEEITIIVKNRKLKIESRDGTLLYTPGPGIYVSDAFCTDLTGDGRENIILLAWKQGSYGEHTPFWITDNKDAWSQHIFIYTWDTTRPDRLDPIWMSSALGIEVTTIDMDSENRIHLTDSDGTETCWEWNHWGLTES